MASQSMKDVIGGIDAAIDGPEPPQNIRSKYATYPLDKPDKHYPTGTPDSLTVGRAFHPPSGDGSGAPQSPIANAINHIQMGRASPQEMMMLQRMLGR